MQTPYSAVAVANYFIEKNKSSNCDLSHLKIQKLLYYAQGWYLANFNGPLFSDDIEAWRHGPVVRSVYKLLSGSRDSTIHNKINMPYMQEGEAIYGSPEVDKSDISTCGFLDAFWEMFKGFSAYSLTNSTHEAGTPWEIIYRQNEDFPFANDIIPRELIQKYFLEIKAGGYK